jgi:predicted transcriptional regulator
MNPSSTFKTFSASIQAAIAQYADASHLTPETVIEVALAHFLELDTASLTEASLETAIERYAAAAEMPPEFVVELAIVHFLDPDAVTFEDCQVGMQREQLEMLKQYRDVRRTAAA